MKKKIAIIGCLPLLLLAGVLVLTGCPDPVNPGPKPVLNVPAAPTGLTAVPAGAGQVNLSWTYPDPSGIIGARIEYGKGTAFNLTYTVQFTTGRPAPATALIENLDNGKEYQFRVLSQNANGWSPPSAPATATPTVPQEPPDAPSAITFDSARMGKGELYAQWAVVSGAGYYNVKYGTTNVESAATQWPATGSADITDTQVLITGLADGTEYWVFVRAGNTAGDSGWVSASHRTKDVPAKVVLGDLIVASGQVTVQWTIPASDAAITGFVVEYGTVASGAFAGTQNAAGTADSAVVSGLANRTAYQFRVRAVSAIGDGAYSDTKKATPLATTAAPAAPKNVRLGHHAVRGELLVQWDGVNEAVHYKVKYGTTNVESNATVLAAEITALEVIIDGLADDTEYWVWVWAWNDFNGSSNGPVSQAVSHKTLGTPAVPDFKINMTNAAVGTIPLTWTLADDAVEMLVKYGTANTEGTATDWAMDVTATGTTITGLDNNTLYYIWVYAKNPIGTSAGTSRSAYTKLATPVVTFVIDNDVGRIVLSLGLWTTAIEAYTPDHTVVYNTVDDVTTAIEPDGTNVTLEFSTSGTNNNRTRRATINGLTPRTMYYFWVKASNANTDSNWSEVISKKAPGVPDVVPAGRFTLSLDQTGTGYGKIQVRWAFRDWQTVPGATGYHVGYSTTNDAETITAGTTITAFTDTGVDITGLSNSTLYYVWIRAANASGNSAWTGPLSETTREAPQTPDTPTVVVRASAAQQLWVEWEPMSTAIEYEVARGTTDDYSAVTSANKYIVTPPVIMQYIPSSTNNTQYYVWVTARNAGGWGGRSMVSAKTNNSAMADQPNVGIDARVRGQLTVKWSAVTSATEYEFRYNSTFNREGATAVTDPTALSNRTFVLTGLADNVERHFWARARVGGEWTPWGYNRGRSQYAPVGQQDSLYPEYTPDLAAMYAKTDKMSVIEGNHPDYSSTTWTTALNSTAMVKRHTAYTSHDPRSMLGYKIGTPRTEVLDRAANATVRTALEANAGKPWFDQLILFNAGLRDRDCLNDKPSVDGAAIGLGWQASNINGKPDNHQCNRQGLHVHLGNYIEPILTGRETYLQPLQDAGIRLILGVLGDWSGVSGPLFGNWPFEDVSPIAGPGHPGVNRYQPGQAPPAKFKDAQGNPWYPYGNNARDAWLMELKNVLNKYRLDGVDYDDEWHNAIPLREYETTNSTGASTWAYSTQPNTYGYYLGEPSPRTSGNATARMDKNLAQFVVAMRETIGPNRVIHLYEWANVRTMQRYVEHPYTGEVVDVSNYFDMFTATQWPDNQSQPRNMNYRADELRPKYGGVAIDVGDKTRVQPVMTGTTPTVLTQIRSHLSTYGHGWVSYYLPLDRYRYAGGRRDYPKGQPTLKISEMADKKTVFDTVTSGSGQGNQMETYLTIMSQVLYGAPVVYNDPAAPALPAPFTGFGYGPFPILTTQPWNLPRVMDDTIN